MIIINGLLRETTARVPNINAPSSYSLTVPFFFFFLVPKGIASEYFNTDLDFSGVRLEGGCLIKTLGDT